jgi:AcrR family transcriptional regulator
MGRKRTITDQELLRHARAVFLQQGRGGATKEIANRAGISEAVLFQRFRTKRELAIAALVPAPINPAEVLQPQSVSQDVRIALAQFGRRMLAHFRQQIPATLHLITSFGVSADEIFATHSAMAPLAGFAEVIARFLMEADARGDVSAPNPMAVASLFIAAVHSLAIFEMRGGHGQGQSHGDAPIDAFVAVLWTGLTPKAT